MSTKHTRYPWQVSRAGGYMRPVGGGRITTIAIDVSVFTPFGVDLYTAIPANITSLITASPRMLSFIEYFLATATVETPQELIAEAEAIIHEVQK